MSTTTLTHNEHTGFLQASDGTRLYYRQWLHPQARAAVVLVHGLGEHGGRYDELIAIFYALGLSVRIHDHRGHGRSEGARGSIRRSEDFLDDLKLVLEDFAGQCQSTPFLFGHSLGGLIAARFATAQLAPVRGLLLSSPALAIRMSSFQKLLLAMTTRLAPGLAVATSLSAQSLSHDPEVVQDYLQDKYNHGKVAARVVNFMLQAMAQALRDAPSFTTPVLLQVAGADSLVDPEGSRRFFAQLPQAHKTWHCYDDAYHEIFNEIAQYRLRVQSDLKLWLEQQLQ